ncbi:DUF4292 domain-containing protein [bacterium]|nr:DUF4292 domain-containing protein [bacterium]
MKSNLIYFAMLAFLMQSCIFYKKEFSPETVSRIRNMQQFTEAYGFVRGKHEYQWLELSGRVKIVSETQNVSLAAQLKSRHDSVVWLRLSKFLEVARAQADVNSLQVLDRINHEYSQFGFNQISAYVDPNEGLSAFEHLLFGKIPFELDGAHFSREEDFFKIRKTDSLEQTVLIDKLNLCMTEYHIESPKTHKSATISFSNYTETSMGLMPKNIVVQLSEGNLSEISMEFSKIEFTNKQKVDFDVPESYHKN